MKDSKLIRLLKTFSKDEWKEFEKFAASPYFNKGRNYLPLLKALKKFYPGFESDKLTPENIYGSVYPSKKYNKNVVNTMASGLFLLAIEYINHLSYFSEGFRKEMDLMNELDKRNLDDIHNTMFKKIVDKLHKEKFSSDHLEKIRIAQQHKIDFSYKYDYEKTAGEYYEKAGDYLFINFIIKVMGHYRNLVTLDDTLNYRSNKTMFKRLIDSFDLESIIAQTKKMHPNISDVIDAILSTILTSVSDEKDLFYSAKRKLFAVHEQIENMYMKDMLVHLEMGSVLRYENGYREFINERHLIHKFWIENNYHIYENGFMQTRVIENATVISAWVKDVLWLKHFLKTQTKHISGDFKEVYKGFCNAHIMFLESDYGAALKLVKKVPYEFTTLKLKVNALELMINYKMKDYEVALMNIDSLKHFLANNKKISEYMRKGYVEYIKIYEKLIDLKNDKRVELGMLKKDLSSLKPSFMIDWVIDEINNL